MPAAEEAAEEEGREEPEKGKKRGRPRKSEAGRKVHCQNFVRFVCCFVSSRWFNTILIRSLC